MMLTVFLFLSIQASGSSIAIAGPVKDMMNGLEKSMALIESGIVESDFKKVEDAAKWIATRPEPGFIEKAKTLAAIGSDAPQFKKADELMRKVAQAIEIASTRHDPDTVRMNARILKAECIGCHQRQNQIFNSQYTDKNASLKPSQKENTSDE